MYNRRCSWKCKSAVFILRSPAGRNKLLAKSNSLIKAMGGGPRRAPVAELPKTYPPIPYPPMGPGPWILYPYTPLYHFRKMNTRKCDLGNPSLQKHNSEGIPENIWYFCWVLVGSGIPKTPTGDSLQYHDRGFAKYPEIPACGTSFSFVL